MSTGAIVVCILGLLVVAADALYVRHGRGGKEYLRASKQAGADWRFVLALVLLCTVGALIAASQFAVAAVVVPSAAAACALLVKDRRRR